MVNLTDEFEKWFDIMHTLFGISHWRNDVLNDMLSVGISFDKNYLHLYNNSPHPSYCTSSDRSWGIRAAFQSDSPELSIVFEQTPASPSPEFQYFLLWSNINDTKLFLSSLSSSLKIVLVWITSSCFSSRSVSSFNLNSLNWFKWFDYYGLLLIENIFHFDH